MRRRPPLGATWVLIPARDEERTLPWVLAGLRRRLPKARVLVISDGSRDGTAEVARAAGADLLEIAESAGYGEAVRAGFEEALRGGAGLVLQMDADGQHEPDSLPALHRALASAEAPDIVIGSRFLHPESYRPSWPRRLGMRFFSGLARILTGRSISDPTSGLRGFSRKALTFFARDSYRSPYHDTDVLVRAHRAGLRIAEVPARMRPAPGGRSMHRGPLTLIYVWRMFWATLFA